VDPSLVIIAALTTAHGLKRELAIGSMRAQSEVFRLCAEIDPSNLAQVKGRVDYLEGHADHRAYLTRATFDGGQTAKLSRRSRIFRNDRR
jgi:hypothetical protein